MTRKLEDGEQDNEQDDDKDATNDTRGVSCSVSCSSRPLPTAYLDEKKSKEDTETCEEATSTLRRLLNKCEEGKNRYQNLHGMMNTRTYPIKRAGQDKITTGTSSTSS